MKNYDDLQRFKEKTQTLDIAFKDMSGQLQEPAENSQWALIRQLANEDASTPFSGSQRIDLPQPQPLRGDEFRAPAASPLMRQPAALSPGGARSRILDSLTDRAPAAATPRSSLFPAPPEDAAPPAVAPVSASPVPPLSVPVASVSTPPVQAFSLPAAAPARRFGGLFRARHSEPVSLPKETLLKPLLEKIALCR
ncbi:MAG: cellulose biosynthesis protein BcsO [Mixta calida]|mgnify:FL=1|uniref:cellulose biosynthesis protein BcsO n=2 Tax=Erwiniaceae TaxID=1903409 RepID=UPI0006616BA9|nr:MULTISPECIES: cellulose biosynthesis protein BcsO [Pantoea]MBS6437263.1 cellulose biosynthesis protein BcsO [Pantoea sp.]MDU2730293.1 cellulose biosynthesis protein BcsO [Pantoea sp.]MDU2734378.1 cellulose biosynthesis protein BcsO [Mixta calida]MDU6079264.1 cellulose biosynthesis protein BcsO [Pantoea sp.]